MKKKQASILLAEYGLRITSSRRALLDILILSEKPLDVATIQAKFAQHKTKVNEVTVYRMLNILIEKRIVKQLDFHEGKFRYELNKTDHHHLICQKCGTVADIEDCPINELEAGILLNQNFLVRQHALEFFGLCANCR